MKKYRVSFIRIIGERKKVETWATISAETKEDARKLFADSLSPSRFRGMYYIKVTEV